MLRSTAFLSGATAAGFELYTIIARTGGPPTPASGDVSASPRRIMLIVRTGGEKSGRSNARLSNAKFALDDSCTPPPGLRQCPVRAGRHAIVRTAIPPPA